jgi:hypothetical protein
MLSVRSAPRQPDYFCLSAALTVRSEDNPTEIRAFFVMGIFLLIADQQPVRAHLVAAKARLKSSHA